MTHAEPKKAPPTRKRRRHGSEKCINNNKKTGVSTQAKKIAKERTQKQQKLSKIDPADDQKSTKR